MHASSTDPTVAALPPELPASSDAWGPPQRFLASREFSKKLDRYLVIDETAEAGLADVARGYDPRLRREVSLRTLRTAAFSDEAREALLREAQTMAKLSHPNVLAIYDVATFHGDVFIAMERVEGATLPEWLTTGTQPWREVIDVLIAAGSGLAAAHAVGVHHGAFVPSHVTIGDDGRVRVTGFGARRTGKSDVAEPNAAEDQRAYCIAALESLTGSRQGIPTRLTAALERGTHVDPQQRWPSMEALLEVLSTAGRERRTRWGAAACAGIVLFAVSFGAVLSRELQAVRCSGAPAQLSAAWNDDLRAQVEAAMLATGAPYAPGAWRRVANVLDDYATDWVAAHRDACEATAIRGEQPAELMDLRMACLHRAKVDLAAAVDVLAHADVEVVEKSADLVGSLPTLARCRDADALRSDVAPPEPADAEAVEAIRVELADANATMRAGKEAQTLPVVERLSAKAASVGYRPLQATVDMHLGFLHRQLGHGGEARAAYANALVRALRVGDRARAAAAATQLIVVAAWHQSSTADARAFLPVAEGLATKGGREEAELRRAKAQVYKQDSAFEDAIVENRAALALYEQSDADELTRVDVRHALAHLTALQGFPEATQQLRNVAADYERLLGREHPKTINALVNLAARLILVDLVESEALGRELVELTQRVNGPEHILHASALGGLAWVLRLRGHYDEAIAMFRRELAIREKHDDVDAIAHAHAALGRTLTDAGRYAEAETECRLAVDMRIRLLGPDHGIIEWTRRCLADLFYETKRYPEALEQLEIRLTITRRVWGAPSGDEGNIRAEMARVLAALRRYDEAEAQFAAGIPLVEEAWGPDGDDTIRAKQWRAELASVRSRR